MEAQIHEDNISEQHPLAGGFSQLLNAQYTQKHVLTPNKVGKNWDFKDVSAYSLLNARS